MSPAAAASVPVSPPLHLEAYLNALVGAEPVAGERHELPLLALDVDAVGAGQLVGRDGQRGPVAGIRAGFRPAAAQRAQVRHQVPVLVVLLGEIAHERGQLRDLAKARKQRFFLVTLVAGGASLQERDDRVDLLELTRVGALADDRLGGPLELDHPLLEPAMGAFHHLQPVLPGRPVPRKPAAHGSGGYHKARLAPRVASGFRFSRAPCLE